MKKTFLFVSIVACAAAQSNNSSAKPAAHKAPVKAEVAASKTPAVSALDKTTLENYVRHLFVWDRSIKVEVGDPKPAPMDGFFEISVRGSKDKASQDIAFYVSKDGKHIIRGDVYQAGENPFKTDLDKLKGVTGLQPNYGTAGAPVVIAEFSDFQCPYCQTEARTMRSNLLTAYPKEVRLYHFDMPIESIHPWARPASIAGRCIFRQNAGAFWEFYDWIYAHQTEVTADNLKAKILEWAKGKDNVDSLQLNRCMDSKETDPEVQMSMDAAKDLQVNQTPMIFINGRKLTGAVEWPNVKAVIDFEIEYQKTAKNAGEDCGCAVALPTPGMPEAKPPIGGLK